MLEKRLAPVMELLRRQTLVEQLVDRTEDRAGLGADVLHRRHRTALAEALSRLHPADIAHLLEMLPPEERSVVWVSAPPETAGQVLAEVNDTVAEGLVAETNRDRLLAIGERLNPVDLALIEDILPGEVRSRLLSEMDEEDRSWLETTVTYPEDSVGHLMTRDVLVIDAHATVKDVLRYVRTLGDLPDNTDKIFVVDRKRHLVGALPLKALIIHSPKRPVAEVMSRDLVAFTPDEEAEDAGQAFQRYDLISAPVVD
ncbi:MAG: CBS domain-containing protein, partial [Gammaproteobacteria bacterium]